MKKQKEIKEKQIQNNGKAHEINETIKVELEKIKIQTDQEKQKSLDSLVALDIKTKRELSQIQFVVDKAEKNYRKIVKEIEIEKENKKKSIEIEHKKNLEEIAEKEIATANEFKKELELISKNKTSSASENDETYLKIKNTYSKASIELNKQITAIEKEYQKGLAVIKKEQIKKITVESKKINDLKEEYEKIQKKVLIGHGDKLRSLNVIFDIQKNKYHEKKLKINHESNETITLLNSKLSTFRETSQEEKLLMSRQIRLEIKSATDVKEKEALSRALTHKLHLIDAELNKQIIRTNKDILGKQREQQSRQYKHDQMHLREINNWRFKKNIFEYQKKKEIAKYDLSLQYDLAALEKQMKTIDFDYQREKELLLLNHKKSLLQLEFGLSNCTLIQEKDLNILSNDTHLLLLDHNYKETISTYELKTKQTLHGLKKDHLVSLFNADTNVLNVCVQLELDKEKRKKNFITEEQELRKKLNSCLFSKTKKSIAATLDKEILKIDSNKELMLIKYKEVLLANKYSLQKNEQYQLFIMRQEKYEVRLKKDFENFNRYLSTYLYELELNQEQATSFISIMIMLHEFQVQLSALVVNLYELPLHPEILKEVLSSIVALTNDMLKSVLELIEDFRNVNNDFYLKKIEDYTGYKYTLKHENTLNYYSDEASKLKQRKDELKVQVNDLEKMFFSLQNESERNQAFIVQLRKISHAIKISKEPNKKMDLQTNQKLLQNHQEAISRIVKKRIEIEKEIGHKHDQIAQISNKDRKLNTQQESSNEKLAKEKQKDGSKLFSFLDKNNLIYKQFSILVQNNYRSINKTYNSLLSEVYLTESFLRDELNNFTKQSHLYEKSLIAYHLKLLKLTLSFYHQNEREQLRLKNEFQKTTVKLKNVSTRSFKKESHSFSNENRKRIKQLSKSISHRNKMIEKKIEFQSLTTQKEMSMQETESNRIESLIAKTEIENINELELIKENQFAVAEHYRKDFDSKVALLNSVAQKKIQSINASISLQRKNRFDYEQTTKIKNNAIGIKYLTTKQSLSDSLKQKEINLGQLIEKEKKDSYKRVIDTKRLLLSNKKKLAEDLENINKHHTRYLKTSKSLQNRILAKELRQLKKSHGFKVKMLHLK